MLRRLGFRRKDNRVLPRNYNDYPIIQLVSLILSMMAEVIDYSGELARLVFVHAANGL